MLREESCLTTLSARAACTPMRRSITSSKCVLRSFRYASQEMETDACCRFHSINGVDYCHRFNICHRDLKPENLLLDQNRNIKVADFGMAALEPLGQMLQTSCGSPHYASPEIVAGKTYHGGPSDIWSCGIILFALLTGHLPFDDENIRTLLLKVKAGRFVMPTELSAEAKDLIWRMLEVDPLKRVKMEQIMQHPLLRKYKSSRKLKLPRAPTYEELGRPVKNAGEIDREILRNLQTLWRGVSKEALVSRLLAADPNSEKTFYCLLLKYRHDRMENYQSDDQPRRLVKSASRRSVASRKSAASSRRKTHKRVGSKSSKKSSSSRRKKQQQQSQVLAPPILGHAEILPPPKRVAPIAPPNRAIDEATRKMSAEFSQFLDVAFNANTKIFQDGYADKALPSPPYDAFALQRPQSAEPQLVPRSTEHKQRAHRSAEVPVVLPRIFEEDKDRYADAEEENPHLREVTRKKSAVVRETHSRASHRAALGELDNNAIGTRRAPTPSSAGLVAPPIVSRSRTASAETPKIVWAEPQRRNVSAPAQTQTYTRDTTAAPAPPPPPAPAPKRNWLDRTLSALKQPNLAARRSAPAPPPLTPPPDISTTAEHASPKQGFFARLLNFKPAQEYLRTTYSANRLHRELCDSIRRWEKAGLGVKLLEEDRRTRTLRAQVRSRNALGLRSVRFRVEVVYASDRKSSVATFVQERGAQSSFLRVVDEYQHIYSDAGVLIT